MTKVIIVYDGLGTCCSDDPRLPYGGHPIAGGMSSSQSSVQYLSSREISDQLFQNIVVDRDASESLVVVVMPGVSVDLKFNVELVGEGAQANIYGAYICAGQEKVKIAVDMHHKVPHCNSRQLFKGIAGGTSKVDFYGKIIVAKDAQRTEAYQENHNLLLSDGAKERQSAD